MERVGRGGEEVLQRKIQASKRQREMGYKQKLGWVGKKGKG